MKKYYIFIIVAIFILSSCGSSGGLTLSPDGYKKTNCKVKKKRR